MTKNPQDSESQSRHCSLLVNLIRNNESPFCQELKSKRMSLYCIIFFSVQTYPTSTFLVRSIERVANGHIVRSHESANSTTGVFLLEVTTEFPVATDCVRVMHETRQTSGLLHHHVWKKRLAENAKTSINAYIFVCLKPRRQKIVTGFHYENKQEKINPANSSIKR